ncbi:hypothetical protein A3I27_00210 [Candidatus Giovannonibacteria bacterium RIFCSPLOWO2_02_FULL_43_11b]|uniref:Glycosyl transferase family 1 domain-containing protein n=1 Tax=Candidatus Giovannonibacteria bacterium RIFCSPHIGHO2_12_FULL_43_15 TaxID=1798341 RepID=A0A1F5WRP7_9BACT|nr:MAG: hypothetical protein A2739_02205 [Candidatus Giovannonibacteria bacterium RIFCSPHIGHO2_01_FULL_43_100]OGF66999.1 MAG: hypothetical protein A3B97_00160 [Candidatus Giovannonibacteria bacterium RIFCSPHIGHO2_02_FULL_43_32]OGF77921.1 MAG: hypothetical protein A3F23_04285 [Candidatus Giovannonibacteria bacterium RIFCSPHIGHO2_12_FULL_43_15]OGF78696.1 MAG: hypothetical protein A3A15_01960 [Candidatus Giovannonibacteria bacterium RIFCSPLOWO2_01_FULL_43_60]OGF89405.1 MAG: hypothetical protein A3
MQNKRGTIVIFSTAYLPLLGGAETAIRGISDNIEDFRLIVLTSRFKKSLPVKEKIGNVMIYRLGLGNRFDKFFLPLTSFVKFIFIKKNLDKPILFWGMMASYGSIGAWLLKFFYNKIPFLLTIQEGDSESHIKRSRFGLVNLFFRLLVKKADRIQAISNYLKDFCIKMGAKVPIDVVPNGVDLKKFIPPSRMETRRPESKVIISVSRKAYKNALDTLEKAFLIVKIKHPEAELRMISDALHQSVPILLWEADVFVRPSRSEGLGTAFLEAMAAGLPIIGTPVGGIPDFLIDGETGLFAKVDDPSDLAQKIELLFTDRALREKLIKNGLKLVEEKYQWSKLARDMEKIFTSLL